MAKNISPYIGGIYKDIAKVGVNIGGAWKDVAKILVNIGGTWKEAWTAQMD